MAKGEVFDLVFIAKVDERNRITIPNEIADVVKTRKGDKVTLVLKEVYRGDINIESH